MRRWLILLGVVAVIGLGVAAYMLKPVRGEARDLTLVADAEHGAYVMTLGGCVACHTDAKSERAMLSGGPGLKTPFGTFYAPNITPDPEFGIGNMTLAAFSDAMTHGEGPGFAQHYYPAFPYTNYTLMSDQDIVDLYAALQAVAPVNVASVPHEVSFPFNIRLSLAGWKNLFFTPGRFEPDPARSDRWNRGKYLVTGPAHCTACHTPRNVLGGPDEAHALEGSSGGPSGNTPGITRARLEAQGYDQASLSQTLLDGFTPGFDVLGREMGEVILESSSKWTDEDRAAVAAYLFDAD